MMTKLLFMLSLIAAFIQLGLTIQCFNCTSLEDDECENGLPTNPEPGLEHKYLIDCSAADKERIEYSIRALPFSLCRKQVQEIDGKKRIIRGCGVIESKQDCYNTANPQIKTIVCQCKDDACNHGHPITSSQLTIGTILFIGSIANFFRV